MGALTKQQRAKKWASMLNDDQKQQAENLAAHSRERFGAQAPAVIRYALAILPPLLPEQRPRAPRLTKRGTAQYEAIKVRHGQDAADQWKALTLELASEPHP